MMMRPHTDRPTSDNVELGEPQKRNTGIQASAQAMENAIESLPPAVISCCIGVFLLSQDRAHRPRKGSPNLDGPNSGCIRFRMTKILTLRLDPALLERAEARAARLGLDRAKYVRSLIEEDLASGENQSGSGFASSDLAGIYEGSGKAATNEETRAQMRRKR
jgi:predicted DNA-binding protein